MYFVTHPLRTHGQYKRPDKTVELAAPKRQTGSCRQPVTGIQEETFVRLRFKEVRLFQSRMKKLTKNQIADHKRFYIPGGDLGFSPERNKAVIEDSIRKYEAERERRQRLFGERLDERSDAVSHFLKAIDRGKATTAMKYFGKKELARLRGEEILGQLYAKKQPKN